MMGLRIPETREKTENPIEVDYDNCFVRELTDIMELVAFYSKYFTRVPRDTLFSLIS